MRYVFQIFQEQPNSMYFALRPFNAAASRIHGVYHPIYNVSHHFQAPVPILESFYNCRVQPVFQSVLPSRQPQGLHGLIFPIERESHLFHLHPCAQIVDGKYQTYMGYSYSESALTFIYTIPSRSIFCTTGFLLPHRKISEGYGFFACERRSRKYSTEYDWWNHRKL